MSERSQVSPKPARSTRIEPRALPASRDSRCVVAALLGLLLFAALSAAPVPAAGFAASPAPAQQPGEQTESERRAEEEARREVERLRAEMRELQRELERRTAEMRRTLAETESEVRDRARALAEEEERSQRQRLVEREQVERQLQVARREADRARAAEARARALALVREPRPVLALLNRKPRLGITVRDADPAGSVGPGALVGSVRSGSPAEEAGLRSGDVIVRFGELALDASTREGDEGPAALLVEAVGATTEGETVSLRVRRGEESIEVDVTPRALEPLVPSVAPMPAVAAVPSPRVPGAAPRAPRGWPTAPGAPLPEAPPAPLVQLFGGGIWHDLEMVPVNEQLGEYFGVEKGLLVVAAPSDGAVALEAGDVIVAIGGREPEDARHAMRILSSYEPGETLEVAVVRRKQRTTLRGEVPRGRRPDSGLLWNHGIDAPSDVLIPRPPSAVPQPGDGPGSGRRHL
ncbi:MAG: PDZ domain-containing protein [Acidobacteria bacterium]|nr:MAG: PDZ domain-containing protein [Acidobacteriota bacterium]